MANEIQIIHDDGAETVYAIVRDMTGLWYVAAAAEAYAIANWATYDIAMAEVDAGGAGVNVALQGTFPAVAAGYYWIDFYIQAGGAPASTDVLLKSILYYWNATSLLPAEAIIGTPAGASVSADVAAVKGVVDITQTTLTPVAVEATGDGNVGGTTVIDAARTEIDEYWNDLTLAITSGACAGQRRAITDFDAGTDTFTVSPAFSAQIVTGVTGRIIATVEDAIKIATDRITSAAMMEDV